MREKHKSTKVRSGHLFLLTERMFSIVVGMYMGPAFSSTSVTSLRDLDVLLLDCQTTGASPRRGHLLEVAWCRTRARQGECAEEADVFATTVALPEGEKVPRRIKRLTGIGQADLERALQPAEVWRRLMRDAGAVVTSAGSTRAPAVSHFARFERGFFEDLCEQHSQPFPLDLICTHEIACRVLPGLPRRGLRAMAGYFGHVLDEHKRAEAHVRATAVVWSHLVDLLQDDWQISSLWDLRLFLQEVKAARGGGRQYPMPRERRLALPATPGVYHMLGKGGEVLYLGKATSLKSRVNSYFQRPRHDNQRTSEWLTQAYDVAVYPEPTPLEAALREADEIKRLAPPYNVALRQREDAVWFTCAGLDDERPQADARHCLGPVPVRGALSTMTLLRDLLAGARLEAPTEAYHAGLPRELEAALLLAGVVELRSRRGRWLGDAPLEAGAVLRLGAWLWRRQRREEEERAGQEPQPEADEPAQEREERVWDAGRVAAALEYSLLRAAQLLRRAHWLCQLSEACLAWETSAGGRRLLEIRGGEVVRADELDPGAPAPCPEGHARPALERMARFDPVMHDRLRVLTTELRRLVARQAELELRLGPDRALDRRALARRLWWF